MIITIEVTTENLDLVYEAVENYKWSIQQLVSKLTSTTDTAALDRFKDKIAKLRELEFEIGDIQERADASWSGNEVLNRALIDADLLP